MPNRNGRGIRNSQGQGQKNRPMGSASCICPSCSHKEPHTQRGVPCSTVACPKCGTMMRGENCYDRPTQTKTN